MKDYCVQEEIYNSGGTRIQKVYDEKRGENYTLKLLSTQNIAKETIKDVEEIFKRERDGLKKVNHPNVIKYINSFVSETDFGILTEYCSGMKSLDKVETNFSDIKKLEIVEDILAGLAECHNCKVLHRDIKPSNILVSEDGSSVKIIDFGLSKVKDIFGEVSGVTLKDYMSPIYASPEQLNRKKISEESDIYSLGISMFYMFLKKEPPINRDEMIKELNNAEIDSKIRSVILKATQKAREDRYSSADVFLQEVEKIRYQIEAEESDLIVCYKPQVASKLIDLGKINSANELIVTKYIKESLEDKPNIYMRSNNAFYLVGDKILYKVEINRKNEFLLDKVWNISIDKYDFEKSKGICIGANIEVVRKEYSVVNDTDSVYIEFLKTKIREAFKKNKDKKLDKNNLDELLRVWNGYLNQKKQEAFNKTEMGLFTGFDYDSFNNFLTINLDSKMVFEKGDIIQLTAKNGKKTRIGEFNKFIEEKKIQVIPQNDFDEKNFSKRGQIGINNYLTNILTHRYSLAMKELLNRTSVNRELLNVLNNPETASIANKKFKVEEKFNNDILPETISILESALSAEDIFLIQGPPGTGKTTLITELIAQIYSANPDSKILFVSPSHVAVDHAMKSIRKILKKINSDIDSRIVRLGQETNISNEHDQFQIERHSENWSNMIKNKSISYLSEEIDGLTVQDEEDKTDNLRNYLLDITKTDRSELIKYLEDENSHNYKKYSIIKDWYQNLSQSEQFEFEIIKSAFLICSTCSGIASYKIFDEIEYDWVIIDEAARATVPELLIPLVRGKRSILVGDHQQLPPVVNFEENEVLSKETKEMLGESLFKKIHIALSDDLKETLSTQFRMKKEIAEMINKLYYKEVDIKNHILNKEYILSDVYKPITWIDTNNSAKHYQVPEGTSFKNYEEVTKINHFLSELNNVLSKLKRQKSVGIISGYEAQKNLIIEDIRNENWPFLDITVNNVDAFQGSEKDIIIYSVVRSNEKQELGFLKDERRLNVSLSRAKEMLVIVGDSNVSEYTPFETNPFRKLFKYILDNRDGCKIV